MEKILENLFYQHNSGQERYAEQRQRISANSGMLKKDFNKWQKKILLRMVDGEGEIADKWAADSFAEGVQYGVMFMMEVFQTERRS